MGIADTAREFKAQRHKEETERREREEQSAARSLVLGNKNAYIRVKRKGYEANLLFLYVDMLAMLFSVSKRGESVFAFEETEKIIFRAIKKPRSNLRNGLVA